MTDKDIKEVKLLINLALIKFVVGGISLFALGWFPIQYYIDSEISKKTMGVMTEIRDYLSLKNESYTNLSTRMTIVENELKSKRDD